MNTYRHHSYIELILYLRRALRKHSANQREYLARLFSVVFVLLSTSLANADPTHSNKPIYKVYLAGPEVFLSDPIQAGVDKKALIKSINKREKWPFTLVGLYPMDNEIPDFKPNQETGMRIYHANIKLMDEADFITANMVRFRGPSMDVGTAFEMGYMAAADKPVFAYYDALPFYGKVEKPGIYKQRVTQYWSMHSTKADLDKDGIHIEDFAMTDNLMMVGAHMDTGYAVAEDFEQAILNIANYILNNKE